MKRVLITGGMGFLANALAHHLKSNYTIILTYHNHQVNDIPFETCHMDIRSEESVRLAIEASDPQIIIHTAAIKSVVQAENDPYSALQANVIGSDILARVAIEKGVGTVIGISSNKAGLPARNFYGISKLMMERIFARYSHLSSTVFISLRVANIMWAPGSFLTLWEGMSQRNEPILTTGYHMKRLITTVGEVVNDISNITENVELLSSRVLTPLVPAARIGDFLDAWIDIFGGEKKLIDPRPGDKPDDILIGKAEIEATEQVILGDKIYFSLNPEELVSNPISVAIDTGNIEYLTLAQCKAIILARQ